MIDSFENYIERGIVRKVKKDFSRSKFLVSNSERSIKALKERIKIIGITNLQANSIIKESYDSIMELIRAILLIKGYNCSGCRSS